MSESWHEEEYQRHFGNILRDLLFHVVSLFLNEKLFTNETRRKRMRSYQTQFGIKGFQNLGSIKKEIC